MSVELKKRLASFGWRVGMMVLAAFVDAVLVNLNMLQLTGVEVVLVGLFLGEVSKYIHNKLGK